MIKVVAIIQARMNSSRLPGKVLRHINGMPMLEVLIHRVQKASTLNEVHVATTFFSQDNPVAQLCDRLGIEVTRWTEENVLARYREAAYRTKADVIVRLTADNPLCCPSIVDKIVTAFVKADVDYASNKLKPTYPIGLDAEVFNRRALDTAAEKATKKEDREHVTMFMYTNPGFKLLSIEDSEDHSNLRWTVDTIEDFDRISMMAKLLGNRLLVAEYKELLTTYELL